MSCEGVQHEGKDVWWEKDARGIPLCQVCNVCRSKRLAAYRPEVLRNPDYEADEDIEPDDGWDATGRGPEPMLDKP